MPWGKVDCSAVPQGSTDDQTRLHQKRNLHYVIYEVRAAAELSVNETASSTLKPQTTLGVVYSSSMNCHFARGYDIVVESAALPSSI